MGLNKEQQRIYQWINEELEMPVFAEAYKGALNLLDQKLEGYVSLVSHVGRDMMNSLATTYKGNNYGRVDYPNLVKDIKSCWKDEWLEGDCYDACDKEGGLWFPISYEACSKISMLLKKHDEGSNRNKENSIMFFTTFLEYLDKDRIPKNSLKDWEDARKWFVSHAHLRKKDFSEDSYKKVSEHFSTLNDYLYIAATSQYERIRTLNDILEDTNG